MQVTLRGAVFGEFKSISEFAKHVGLDRKKASNIVNGHQRPSADEMERMAEVLHVQDAKTFMSLFFPSMSTM